MGTYPATTVAATPARAARKVVIVNGTASALGLLEMALDAPRYDVFLVASSAHAYSQIKVVRPDLIILGLRIDDPDGYQVLSMLRIDADTRMIPVVTFTTEPGGQDADESGAPPDESIFAPQPAALMN